jgi:hypothetical protein
MASPTKETWKKRDRRDAKLLKKRQTRLRRARSKTVTLDKVLAS